ncbi:MAG: hypothetical protein CSA70_05190 [Rhodobacterales bacterium]|nr:MAG: hypothetical protein CSA70_05190 [Rhodobacterales bacterium]
MILPLSRIAITWHQLASAVINARPSEQLRKPLVMKSSPMRWLVTPPARISHMDKTPPFWPPDTRAFGKVRPVDQASSMRPSPSRPTTRKTSEKRRARTRAP